MSKCQKGEVTQRGKGKFLFIERSNTIIFRLNVFFRMSFAQHLQFEAPTPPPSLLFSCKNEGKHHFPLINKILWVKSQSGVAYKSVAYKKSCEIVLQSFRHKKNDFVTWVYFCVYSVFNWGYLAKKYCQKCKLQKDIKRESGWLYRSEIVYRRVLNFLDTAAMFYVLYNSHYA